MTNKQLCKAISIFIFAIVIIYEISIYMQN